MVHLKLKQDIFYWILCLLLFLVSRFFFQKSQKIRQICTLGGHKGGQLVMEEIPKMIFFSIFILEILFDNFFDAKRHICEIGQCFWELYLIKRICTFQVHILVYFKYVRPNLIIIFFIIFFLWYQKKGWIVVLMNFFSFSFFSQLFSVGSVWVALAVIAWIYQQFLFFVFLEYNHYLQSYVQQRSWMPSDGEMHYKVFFVFVLVIS